METPVKENSLLPDDKLHQSKEMTEVTVGCGKGYLVFKRMADIVFSVFGILLLFVPMLIVAIVIRVDSKGPVIFKQQRMGRNAEPFTIYKFRTMKTDAPAEKASRDFLDSDRFITKVGKFLRRTSIDEIPQLFNILKGDMSFVGYRPVCLTECNLNELRKKYGVFVLRPGVTGLAQVSGRDNVYGEKKARLDAEYVKQCSAKMDLFCIWKTIKTVFTGEGAF